MLKLTEDKQLCFDDILMVPQYSKVMSRSEIDLRMPFGNNTHLEFPVVASPMDTVCEYDMAVSMAKAGGIGIIHRFMEINKQCDMVAKIVKNSLVVGAAVGAKGSYLEDARKLVYAGASLILIDTANGHSEYAISAVSNLRKNFPDIHIMFDKHIFYHAHILLSKNDDDTILHTNCSNEHQQNLQWLVLLE